MATPCAVGSLILKSFITRGAITAPVTPLITTRTAVIAEAPPYSSEREIAIAVVIDCGVEETTRFSSMPRKLEAKITKKTAIAEPKIVPDKIGIKFS